MVIQVEYLNFTKQCNLLKKKLLQTFDQTNLMGALALDSIRKFT